MTVEHEVMELLEESSDLHSDGMRRTREALDVIVDTHRRCGGAVGRRDLLRRSIFAAGALGGGWGAALLGRAVTAVHADSTTDVQQLQTAAAIENLAIAVYNQAAQLPATTSGASIPVVATFVTTTIKQHTDHLTAFNDAVARLGGKRQTGVDATLKTSVVDPAVAAIKGPSDVLKLAITLENGAAATYIVFARDAGDAQARGLFASVAPVEAQHAAVLVAVKALVDLGAPQLIAIPPDLTKLPGAAGGIGFPDAFAKIDAARPAAEGALS